MRRLLLLALTGMAFSKMYFATFVPPELKLRAPGFDLMKDGANAPKPRWFASGAPASSLAPSSMFPRYQRRMPELKEAMPSTSRAPRRARIKGALKPLLNATPLSKKSGLARRLDDAGRASDLARSAGSPL